MKAPLPILLAATVLINQTASAASFDYSGYVGAWTGYVLDNGFAPNKNPGVKADLFISHVSGLHLDLWGWGGLTKHLNNEIDTCPGYSNLSFKIDLCYYEIANPNGVDMTAPLIEIYPAKGWTTGAQYYFGTTGDRGKKFWAGYVKGSWSGQLSYTDFFGRVTSFTGSWTHPISKNLSFSATGIAPIADPDHTRNDKHLILGLKYGF